MTEVVFECPRCGIQEKCGEGSRVCPRCGRAIKRVEYEREESLIEGKPIAGRTIEVERDGYARVVFEEGEFCITEPYVGGTIGTPINYDFIVWRKTAEGYENCCSCKSIGCAEVCLKALTRFYLSGGR